MIQVFKSTVWILKALSLTLPQIEKKRKRKTKRTSPSPFPFQSPKSGQKMENQNVTISTSNQNSWPIFIENAIHCWKYWVVFNIVNSFSFHSNSLYDNIIVNVQSLSNKLLIAVTASYQRFLFDFFYFSFHLNDVVDGGHWKCNFILIPLSFDSSKYNNRNRVQFKNRFLQYILLNFQVFDTMNK